jgi:hypothetical protein
MIIIITTRHARPSIAGSIDVDAFFDSTGAKPVVTSSITG